MQNIWPICSCYFESVVPSREAEGVLQHADPISPQVSTRRLRLALVGTVVVASLLPCRGTSAGIFHALGFLAVALLFFLQGALLSRAALFAGAEHWRL